MTIAAYIIMGFGAIMFIFGLFFLKRNNDVKDFLLALTNICAELDKQQLKDRGFVQKSWLNYAEKMANKYDEFLWNPFKSLKVEDYINIED